MCQENWDTTLQNRQFTDQLDQYLWFYQEKHIERSNNFGDEALELVNQNQFLEMGKHDEG